MVKTESTEIFKTLDIYQKCQKYTGIFGFSTVSVKNVENIPEFQAFWRYLSTQKQQNGLNSTKNESKNGQKTQKLDQNFRLHTKKWPTFNLFDICRKCIHMYWYECTGFPGTFSQKCTKFQNPYRNAWPYLQAIF